MVMAASRGNAVESRPAAPDELRRSAAAGQLFAVLDACDEPAVPAKVLELGADRAVSLYRGGPEEEFWDVAPYLVRVDPATLDWIADRLGASPWGLFAIAGATLDALRQHFRRFLQVRSPEGPTWYFRFYDPRVLPTFLATCTDAEVTALFGPVRAFGVGLPEPGPASILTRRGAPTSGPYYPPPPAGKGPLLALRPEQVEAFRPQVEAAFERRVADHLREEHADAVAALDEATLGRRVRRGLARARALGIEWDSSLVTFVALMFEFAPNFDEHPRFREFLARPGLSPDERLDLLVDEATEEDWIEVERRADPSAWEAAPRLETPPRRGPGPSRIDWDA